MGKTRGKDNQGFCFHQVDFNIPIKHWRGDGVVKYRSMRFQGEAKTENEE